MVISEVELCADEQVVGGGVGGSYDRRRWRRRRQTGWKSTETAHSLDRRFLVLQGSATSPVIAAGVEKWTVNMHAVNNFTVLMS